LNRTRPDDQAAHCIRDVLRKVPQLAAEEIGDVILGCAEPAGPQGMNVGRVAAIRAGLPVTVPGTTVNRFCSSGLQAIAMAAHQIIHEEVEIAIGGGVESITASARVKPDPEFTINPWVADQKPGIYMVMGDTAEVVAKRYKISREAQDQYALSSQERTARAQRGGFFAAELAPMKVSRGLLDKQTGAIAGQEEHEIAQDE